MAFFPKAGLLWLNLMHTAHCFRGQLEAISQPAGILSLALRWRPSPRWMIDVGFSEDVVVEASPDITFLVNARWSPSRKLRHADIGDA